MFAVFASASGAAVTPQAQLAAYGEAFRCCANVAASPSEPAGWSELGQLLYGKGRLAGARLALNRAVQLAPSVADTRITLANVLRAEGSFDAARENLREAEALQKGQALKTLARDQFQALQYAPPPRELAAAPPYRELAPDMEAWVTRICSPDECEWLISTAEAKATADGGWGNPPPRYAPVGTVADNVRAPHMLVADSPELLDWLNEKMRSTIWPLLVDQFGLHESDGELWLYDAFLLRFDGQPGQQGLGMHVDDDGRGISFNLQLSELSAFEGGGTVFADLGGDGLVKAGPGELLSHYSGLPHASGPTTGGRRHILVGFIRSTALLEREPPPPPLIEEVRARRAARQLGLQVGAGLVGGCLAVGAASGVFDPATLATTVGAAGAVGAAGVAGAWLRNEEWGAPLDEATAVEVRPAAGKGDGLFAKVPIDEGTFLFAYEGEELDEEAFFRRYPKADGRYIACLTDDLYIDGADAAKSNVARWMNHASAAKANVAWRKQTIGPRKAMRFYATRAISPGEELCFDYDASGSYWEALGETPLD